MPSFWISESLTTQEWVSNRGDFLFESMEAHLSGYWSGGVSYLQYGQILHGIAEEIAKLDGYGNWVLDQGGADSLDPRFAHASEAPMLKLGATYPRNNWYDTEYRKFLVTLGKLYLEGSTIESIRAIFQAYLTVSRTSTVIRVDELWRLNGVDTPENIVDQHIANIQIPVTTLISETTEDILDLFDNIKPAHVMLRLVVDPMGKGDFIHGATISDPFYHKLYIIEERPPLVLLTWADSASSPTWFTQSVVSMDPALLVSVESYPQKTIGGVPYPAATPMDLSWLSSSLLENNMALNQSQSGVLSPGIAPTSRYTTSSYELILI
jgi:hypothetical protein